MITIKNRPLKGSVAKLCTETIKFDLTRNVPNTAAINEYRAKFNDQSFN